MASILGEALLLLSLSEWQTIIISDNPIFRGKKITREVIKIGKRESIIIPSALRNQLHLHEGDLVIMEIYSAERKAEFLLSNAIDRSDYEAARKEVEAIGLNPNNIIHHKPQQAGEY